MKLTVSRRELADALKVVQKAVAVKPQTPILAGIYLKAEGSTVELQANNFTLGIIGKVAALVEEGGEIVLGGKTLFEMVQKLSGETVTISYTQGDATAEIKSASTKYSLLAMTADDFTKIKREDNLQTFKLRQAKLKNLIAKSAFAAAKNEESRPIFTGVLFHFNGEKLTIAATNTHRISTISAPLETPADGEKKYLVPAKTLQEISAMLDTGLIEISFSEKQANFNFNNIFVTTRLISGDFPPFDRLFNEEKTIFAEVDAKDFLQAIERVAVIAKVTSYETVRLNFADNEIKITATSPDVGNAEEIVTAEITGGELQISFNHNYLVDALKVAGDKVKIGLSESLKPVTCQFEDFQYIVTPVRTND